MTKLELEYRSASLTEVRHAQRIIDLIAIPYDEETRVLHRGRLITESVAPGSFQSVDREVRVNRAHDLEHPLGKVWKMHPNDPRGLRAELKIAKTLSGDETLELADEGLLGASVGFAPLPGGESYTADRTRRRITKAFLAHIAMTGDPAYEGARVLAVRSGQPVDVERIPTPNLDALLADRRVSMIDAAPVGE